MPEVRASALLRSDLFHDRRRRNDTKSRLTAGARPVAESRMFDYRLELVDLDLDMDVDLDSGPRTSAPERRRPGPGPRPGPRGFSALRGSSGTKYADGPCDSPSATHGPPSGATANSSAATRSSARRSRTSLRAGHDSAGSAPRSAAPARDCCSS